RHHALTPQSRLVDDDVVAVRVGTEGDERFAARVERDVDVIAEEARLQGLLLPAERSSAELEDAGRLVADYDAAPGVVGHGIGEEMLGLRGERSPGIAREVEQPGRVAPY